LPIQVRETQSAFHPRAQRKALSVVSMRVCIERCGSVKIKLDELSRITYKLPRLRHRTLPRIFDAAPQTEAKTIN
jgi:hypothetical protein